MEKPTYMGNPRTQCRTKECQRARKKKKHEIGVYFSLNIEIDL